MSGIYIHIPFCKQACYYCDFHFSTSLSKKDQMLQAIHEELILRKQEITDVVETIYFGGGTPSLLSTKEINSTIALIKENFEVVVNPEITLEANPDDLSKGKIEGRSLFHNTFDTDLTAMRFHRQFTESQAQPSRPHAAGAFGFDLPELVKHCIQFVRRDALAIISHFDPHKT